MKYVFFADAKSMLRNIDAVTYAPSQCPENNICPKQNQCSEAQLSEETT